MNTVHFLALEQRGPTLIISVLRNVGCFSHEEFQDEWIDLLKRLDDPAILNVIVDFQRVAYFGSIVLEMALHLSRRLQSRAGRVVLCNLSSFGVDIMRAAKFDQLWPIVDSLDDALKTL